MMRWLVLALLLACNGNGSGLHDFKNGGDADDDIADIDEHTARPGVWNCVSITGLSVSDYPCQDTLEKCEADRSFALSKKYDASTCERFSFAMCFARRR